jgi:DNA-binding transcriptional LysR family regulator
VGGHIQVAVGYFWHRAPTLEYTTLFVERQIAYCSPTHVLAGKAGKAIMEDLQGVEWVWRSYPLPEASMTVPARSVTAVADNMEAAAILILSGRHLGYLPEHFAASYVKAGLLVAINPKHFYYDVKHQMASRKQAYLDDVGKAFVEDMRHVHLGQSHE